MTDFTLHELFLFFFFAALHSLQDIRFSTRDGTWASAVKTLSPNN